MHDSPLRLRVLDASETGGGVCLDGTPPAYYYAPGVGSGSTSWLIFLKGGGWCMDEFACRYRSKGLEGGTSKLKPTQQLSGMLSGDPLVNPTFAHFHRAYLWCTRLPLRTLARSVVHCSVAPPLRTLARCDS